MTKPKYVLEEKKNGKWRQVGKPMGSRTARFGKAVLSRSSSDTKKKNRIRQA